MSDELNAEKAATKAADYENRFKIAASTAKWAVTMAQVRIRQAVARSPFPHWHILSFVGKRGFDATGVVDLVAIRKDHKFKLEGMKRGDAFQIILIQVKGGAAARPTAADGIRLRKVQQLHHAKDVLLASWKKGTAAKFYTLLPKAVKGKDDWIEVEDLTARFH